jgi:glutamyl-tRNA synthetase/glutamyl-Q tRNA(Asp) synthetase
MRLAAENLRSCPPRPVTRFAPSPTGFLHLGHVASAACVWGIGRALGAEILLRIEDHDRGRCRSEFEAAIYADLQWLGFSHDNAELRSGERSRFRQSDNTARYEAALARLAAEGAVYACQCTRAQIKAASDAAADELWYPGTCRARGIALGAPDAGLRVRVPDGEQRFADLWLGPQAQNPARQCGDLLIRDRHGSWTYQFAVTIDDLEQGVNLIIRGQDLTPSTGRQLWLGRRLGRADDAVFLHHPLLKDEDGKKLSKRFLAEAVAQRRAAGEAPEAVLGEAAFLLGLTPKLEPLAARELPALFQAVH